MSFAKILAQAAQVKDEIENRGQGGQKYLFLGDGTTKIRLLFEPKSEQVMRLIKRHWVDGLKKHVACLEMYGMKCPICEANKEWEGKGNELTWKNAPQTRMLSFITVGDMQSPSESVKKGDTAVLVAPKSVYQAINQLLVEQAENIEKIVMTPTGLPLNITKIAGVQVSYTVQPDPFKMITSAANEAEMKELLDGLGNLNEVMFPSATTPELIKSVEEGAKSYRISLGLTPEPLVDAVDMPPAK